MARHPAIDAEAAGMDRDRGQCGVEHWLHRAAVQRSGDANLLGEAAVAMQAITVGVFAELQFVGLRRSGDAVPA
jgi:hypothetical protein